MSIPPPAPAPAMPPKKGLSPLAWVAMGCGCLILLVGGCTIVSTFFIAKVGNEFVEDFEENPHKLAEMLARINPEIEVLDTDREAGKVTIRHKRDGKVITIDLDDLKQGRLSFETEGEDGHRESVEIQAGENGIVVADPEGSSKLEIGADTADDLPDWIPVPAGTTPTGAFRMEQSDGASGGTFRLESELSPEAIIEYFKSELEPLGFEVTSTQMSTQEGLGGVLNGVEKRGRRKLSATISTTGGQSTVIVQYSEGSG